MTNLQGYVKQQEGRINIQILGVKGLIHISVALHGYNELSVVPTQGNSIDVHHIILSVFLRFYCSTTNLSMYIFTITTAKPFDLKLYIGKIA